MSNKTRLKKKKSGANLRGKARISAEQRSVLSETIETAIHFHQGGSFHQAEKYYRQALAIDPDDPNANNFLGMLYHQTGNISAAMPLVERAIQAKPDFPNAHNNMGIILKVTGHYQAALDSFQKAINLQPDYAEAHANRGNVSITLDRIDDAIAIFSRLLILKPNFPNAYHIFSLIILGKIMPDSIGSPKDRKRVLANCLKKNDLNPQNFFHACLSELFREDILEEVHKFIATEENSESYLHFIENSPLSKLFSEQLFSLMLKRTLVADQLAETFLTRLRKSLAMLLATNEMDEQFYAKMTPVVCAIAHQCYWNEYVYQTTETEAKFLSEIIGRLRDANSLTPPQSVICLALLACYAPLNSYNIADNLLRNAATSEALTELIQVHLVETSTEKELLKRIQSFSEISDKISHQVKQQYEENPYPRWKGIFLAPPQPFIKHLRQDIAPHAPADLQAFERPEVLVAGCGTGRQPIKCASRYLNSSIVAIDLSLTSLAYAKRKADELKIKNIEFIQGDILELPKLGKTFDIIECSGVLHHMSNPEKGFQILLGLLRPSGYMKIALYSELARQHIVSAQEFARNHGFAPSIEGIRDCRQALLALPDDDLAKPVTVGQEFYAASTVRDFIFHVQEHRFTLPEISRLLAKLDLEFLGFTLHKSIKNAYLAEHGDDPGAISLSYWHQYELDHPGTFLGMYDFWVRKKKPLES